ncbi:hypothetical protein BZA05DRAFT_455705 [Tricharina praecox]|uniref:uncharacterized protein n=1 Tax=Tricharina praecox TaxID=43433 RepID=UPI002220642F|nr:uncharacterized protein BZA05DRAFT_455705 [Tricharina praecox]KAI5848342.1 hypothetical protein BZA05DRAFT_455705 [Tricharina praecox]
MPHIQLLHIRQSASTGAEVGRSIGISIGTIISIVAVISIIVLFYLRREKEPSFSTAAPNAMDPEALAKEALMEAETEAKAKAEEEEEEETEEEEEEEEQEAVVVVVVDMGTEVGMEVNILAAEESTKGILNGYQEETEPEPGDASTTVDHHRRRGRDQDRQGMNFNFSVPGHVALTASPALIRIPSASPKTQWSIYHYFRAVFISGIPSAASAYINRLPERYATGAFHRVQFLTLAISSNCSTTSTPRLPTASAIHYYIRFLYSERTA